MRWHQWQCNVLDQFREVRHEDRTPSRVVLITVMCHVSIVHVTIARAVIV